MTEYTLIRKSTHCTVPGNLIVILAGNELPRSMSRCYRHRNIRYYSEADLNTERKSSAGAMDSEFQSHLQYVAQDILQITGLRGKILIIICVANIPGWFSKITKIFVVFYWNFNRNFNLTFSLTKCEHREVFKVCSTIF